MSEEGWYRDPFGRHEDRWFSDGQPTKLVRDHGVEGRDEPPSTSFERPLTEVVAAAPADGSDLKRADNSGPTFDERVRDAISDGFGRTTPDGGFGGF